MSVSINKMNVELWVTNVLGFSYCFVAVNCYSFIIILIRQQSKQKLKK